MKALIHLIFNILFFVFGFVAKGQKLPNVQQVSLYASPDIKVDGKATEWNNQFQAYNHATNIYYTIANDDKYLYLVVQASQAKDPGIINKILGGGITFSINKSGKKDLKDAVSITYPILKEGDRMGVNFSADDNKKIVPGITTPFMQGDSFVMVNNKRLADKSKYVKVIGIKGVDTLISIYNRQIIKATSLFDNKMAYTYELAIDLKQLGLDTANPVKFAYNITLPGLPNFVMEAYSEGKVPPGMTLTFLGHTPPPHGVDLQASTYFWAKYTLAKK